MNWCELLLGCTTAPVSFTVNRDCRIQKLVSEIDYLLKQANGFLQIPIETMQDKKKSPLILIGVIMVTSTWTLSVLCGVMGSGHQSEE